MSRRRHGLVAALALALTSFLSATGTVRAISISLEYVDPADSFFSTEAKATLAKAASDLSTAITTTLAPLNHSLYQGTSLTTTASATWQLSYTNTYT